MNIPDEDLAILKAAAPFINASLFDASDLLEIYRREMARSDDIDTGLEKVELVLFYRAVLKGSTQVV